MRKIAFLGTRHWNDAQRVCFQINDCFNEHGAFILVSGGADGASKIAESFAGEMGLPIISFRPVQISDAVYGVDEWRMYRGQAKIIRDELTWRDWKSAASYRSLLIAERADEGFAYWDGYSRGTGFEIQCFDAADKSLTVANLRLESGGLK